METNRIYNQDCIAGMKAMDEASVHLAFADPPFNIGYKYDVYEDRRAADEYLEWTKQWGQALVQTLRPDGTVWLAIGDDFAAELKRIFQRDLGLTCRSWVIWYYTFGVNCKTKFSRSHTHLFHFVRDPKKFTFNVDQIRVPSARQLVYADDRADAKGRLPDDTWILRPQDLPEGFQPDENTWFFPRVCGTFKERAGWHGCQMPEQLLGRIIRACSNPGELVLDPFGGSGTTLVTAKKLGRNFIGFELSKSYATRVQKRLESVSVGDPLAGAEEPKVSAPSTAKGKKRQDVLPPVVLRTKPDDVNRGIDEAFFLSRDGFSVDRVIVDPDLNASFIDCCRRLGLQDKPNELNRRLMKRRKDGYYKGLPRSLVTTFPREDAEFEKYKFACEIAVERFRREGNPLDHVLCDPNLAARFDLLVRTMLPEPLTSLKIRWFALRLRKCNTVDYKSRARKVKVEDLPLNYGDPFSLKLDRLPTTPSLYWLRCKEGHNLYVGETPNLRERLELQFLHSRFDFWGENKRNLELGYRSVENEEILVPNQARWIAEWNPSPIGNMITLAVAG